MVKSEVPLGKIISKEVIDFLVSIATKLLAVLILSSALELSITDLYQLRVVPWGRFLVRPTISVLLLGLLPI